MTEPSKPASITGQQPAVTSPGIVAKVPDEPGKVWFQVEAVPFWPGANGEDWQTGTLEAADVARALRCIADRCERYWNAEAVERPTPTPVGNDTDHASERPAAAARSCWRRLRLHHYGLWHVYYGGGYRFCEVCGHKQRGTDWAGPR